MPELNIYTMANEKATSSKKIGGNLVAPGRYVINRALISDDVLKQDGQADKPYDTLEVELFHLDANNQLGVQCLNNLRLNGCWRARKGSDGQPYSHRGTFYDKFLGATTGKDFTAGRNYINATLRGYAIDVVHHRYPSTTGDFGTVYEIAISQQPVVANLPALPPIPAATQGTSTPQGQAQGGAAPLF
jgi:hypothetical protein